MSARFSDLPMMHTLEALGGASLLILLVLLLRKPAARHFGAGLAYGLWLLPLARLVLPPLPGGVSVFSWLKVPLGGADTAAPMAVSHEVSAHMPAAAGMDWTFETSALTPAHAAPEAGAGLLTLLALTGLAVWIAGAVWMAGRSLLAHARFMAVVDREGTLLTGQLAALAADVSAQTGLKRSPRVVTSLIASGPFMTGLVRPTIVLPAWFAEDYTEAEARAALAHEMMHVKRGDLWALQAAELFVAALWVNPIVYVARRAFRTDQEAACDADVLARGHLSPHAYGATLVKAVRLQTPARLNLATGLPLTHALKERLKLMSYPAPDTRRRWTGMAAAALIGTGALAATASIAAADEPGDVKELQIRNGTAWLDGEKVEDRQIVLLSDPAAGILPTPPLKPGEMPEVQVLKLRIAEDVAELTGPEVLGPIIRLSSEGLGQEIGEVARELGRVKSEAGQLRAQRGDDPATAERLQALDERAQALKEQIQAISGSFAPQITAETEARIRVIEHRIENRTAEIQASVEHQYGPDFKDRVRARSGMISELVAECRDTPLGSGETRVLSRAGPDGGLVKIACLEGAPGTLAAGSAITLLGDLPGLTEEERERLQQAGTGKQFTLINRSSRDGVAGYPAAPQPPEAPEAPSAPEWP